MKNDLINIIDSSETEDLTKLNNYYHLELWPMYVFLISATTCLLFSATYHLFFTMGIKT